MRISKYPHTGYRIAPITLKCILDKRIPKQLRGTAYPANAKLYELDESSWDKLPAKTCKKLSKIIVAKVNSALCSAPYYKKSALLQINLPNLPEGKKIHDLELEIRTYNCLAKAGYLESSQDLSGLTVGDVLGIPGFGMKSLVDLLTSLETSAPVKKTSADITDEVSPVDGRTVLVEPIPEKELQLLKKRKINVIIFPYPRYNYPLVPKTLKAIFDVSISSPKFIKGERLCNLDARIWHRCTVGQCNQLERIVVKYLSSKCLYSLPLYIRNHYLYNFRLKDIESLVLDYRTYNCLKRVGLLENMACIAKATIGQLLHIRGFGWKCLLDLLVSLEVAVLSAESGKQIEMFPHQTNRTLEEELKGLISFEVSTTTRKAIVCRFGLDGRKPQTLEVIGTKLHLTRERVRQFCVGFVAFLKKVKPRTPKLEQTLNYIVQNIPASADYMTSRLQSEGMLSRKFDFESLLSVAKLFSYKVPFRIVNSGKQQFIIPPEINFSMVENVTKKTIATWGVATVDEIASKLEERSSKPLKQHQLRKILMLLKDVKWLDKDNRWFWIHFLPRNRLLNRIDKILSVAAKIHVSELRSAIARDYCFRSFAPPSRVLLELCRRMAGCRVEGNFIICDKPLPWETLFSDGELAMITILCDYGPIINSQKFEKICIDSGLSRSTFIRHLTYSPAIVRYGRGLYSLVGANILPGYVESVQKESRKRKKRVLLDYGWHHGKIWLGYRLSRNMIHSGCFSIPRSMKNLFNREFALETEEGETMAKLVLTENGGWGLNKLFRRRGGEPGDYLALVFDINKRKTLAYMGDSNLFYELQLLD